MSRTLSLSFPLFVSIVAIGCSSSTPDAAAADPIAVTPPAGVEQGCPAECTGDQTCQGNVCQDPSARQIAQAKSIAALVDSLSENSGWYGPVDAAAVKLRERGSVLKGDGTDNAFFGAAWRTMNAFPQGHQALFSSAPGVCGQAMAYQQRSRFGVCGRPSSAGLAVTVARADNRLGLKVGDVVTSAGGDSGDELFEASYLRPVCGAVFPAASGRRYAGAASFFGNVPAGMKLTVRAPDGTTHDVTVPAESDPRATDCTDPFSRDRQIYAEATVRPDGVAVIRLPSFSPFDKSLPANPTQADNDAFIAAYQGEIVKIFDTVKSAPAIIWDTRGNTGGTSAVGLAIVSGFPSARTTAISYCRDRVIGTLPIAYDTQRYAEYGVAPGGPFTYPGKVAVVADGLAYSAGDYFPLAVAKSSDAPLVGSASAGAYGGGRIPIPLDGPPSMSANYDPTACFDAVTDKPLEGAPLPPKVAIEYDPKDLAAGKDTIVERAVKELGF